MKQKSIIATCCLLGLICVLFVVCAAAGDETVTSGIMEVYEAAENVFSEEDTTVLKTQEMQQLTADEECYQQYIDQLDNALADIASRQQNCSVYRENVNDLYSFGEDMCGWLLAAYDEQGIFLVDWLMEVSVNEEENYQRYRLYLFDEGSQYFTYQTDGRGIEEDIPDYLVNEDTLRHYRLDYVYDDGSDLEEKQRREEETWQDGFDRTISGETLEFWYTDGKLYVIGRQEETMTDVSDTKAICISAFLQLLPDQIATELNMDETKAVIAEELIPDGYGLLLNNWDKNMAAYDLNEDGSMDYVMVLYPEDYPEEKRYEGFNRDEHIPEYYASELWLFLSDSEQGYLPLQLTDSIEYPFEDALVLTDVGFVGEGILRLEYFVGRSPWCTAVLLFAPCIDQNHEKNFYLLRSYYRDYSICAGEIQIGDRDSFGEIDIESYYYGMRRYSERHRVYAEQTPLKDNNVLRYYSSSRYSCDNIMKEEMINSQIWQRENDILEAVQNIFVCESFRIRIDPVFWNSRIVSQESELEVRDGMRLKGEKEEELAWRVSIPIMLDRDTGEIINVTDFITKEEFLELFEHYACKTGLGYIYAPLTGTEKEQCIAILEEGWETADSLDSLTAFDWKEISLQITQQGLIVGLRTEDGTYRLTDYRIDKEHFMGTELWYYLAPEWMQ